MSNQNESVDPAGSPQFHFSPLTFEQLRERQSGFVSARNWSQFQTPRNLVLALVGEVGEIAEHFQWQSDEQCRVGLPDWTEQQRSALGDELGDVLMYLVSLSNQCQIDLASAVMRKLSANELKYPVEKAFGKKLKYDQL